MRLVDADALKEQFTEGAYTSKGVREIIDNTPTVSDYLVEIARKNFELGRSIGKAESEIVENITRERTQKGEWILVDDTEKFIAKCSVCGRIEDSRMVKDYQFCHCGAKMNADKWGK